jgi:hypothetical protein
MYYVIRHKPSRLCMPARLTSPGQHWTHWDPGAADSPRLAPRLFTRESAARTALGYWLSGAWIAETTLPSVEDPEVVGITSVPRPTRRAEDMEVIPVYLTLRMLQPQGAA